MLLWQTMTITNNVLVHGNKRTRCSNSLVEAQKPLWFKKKKTQCCHKRGKNVAEATLSHTLKRQSCQPYKIPFFGLVVFDSVPVTGVSSLPMKPIQCFPATRFCTVCQSINEQDITLILAIICYSLRRDLKPLSVPGEMQHKKTPCTRGFQ